jgi:hypothetical protein
LSSFFGGFSSSITSISTAAGRTSGVGAGKDVASLARGAGAAVSIFGGIEATGASVDVEAASTGVAAVADTMDGSTLGVGTGVAVAEAMGAGVVSGAGGDAVEARVSSLRVLRVNSLKTCFVLYRRFNDMMSVRYLLRALRRII